MSCAAAVFVKTPGHSPLKTRLAATIGSEAAECLHVASARAVAAVLRACGTNVDPFYAVAEPEALGAWSELPTIGQGDGALGERIDHVHARLQHSHGRVLLLGADAPQLTTTLLHGAAHALRDPAPCIVFGAAADGGFWLFGSNRPLPRALWTSVPYSRRDTGQALLNAIAGMAPDCSIMQLPRLHDLDTTADIAPVLAALDALPAPLPAQREVAALLRAHSLPAWPGERQP